MPKFTREKSAGWGYKKATPPGRTGGVSTLMEFSDDGARIAGMAYRCNWCLTASPPVKLPAHAAITMTASVA